MTDQTSRVDRMLARAQEALEEGEPESALQVLETEPRPRGPEVELLRARCHTFIAEDFDAALAALVRAGAAGAEPEAVHAAYLPLRAAALSRKPHVRLLSWLAPRMDDPDLAVTLAGLQLRLGLHDEAEATARGVLARWPAHAEAWRALFSAVMSSERPERGIDVLRAALADSPADPGFREIKGLFAGMTSAETDALVAEVLAVWPGSRIARQTGRIRLGRPPAPEAGGAYRAAIEGDLEGALARADAYLETRVGRTLTVQDRTLRDVLRALPGPDTRTRPLIVDDGSEVLSSAPSESGVTVLVFANLIHRTIYQAEVIDALSAAHGAATMVLRDYSHRLFIGGIESLADSRAGTLDALVEALHGLGTRQLLVAGISLGGFSGASYGRELGAERILGLSIPSSIGRFLRGEDRRARMLIAKLARSFPPEELDLRLKLQAIPGRTPIEVYYGEDYAVDRDHARDLGGLDGVTLRPIPGLERHQSLPSLVLDGSYGRWIADPARDDM